MATLENQDAELDSGNDSDSQEEGNLGENPTNQTDSSDPQTRTDEGNEGDVQSPFNHPALKGLSEEDVAARIALASSTIKAQSRRLNAMEERLNNAPAGNNQPATEQPKIEASEFWSNPQEVLPKLIAPMIREQLRDAVGPLVADLQVNKLKGAWKEVADKYDDFENFREYCEETIKAYGIESPTAGLIESVYKMGVGEAAINGNYRMNRGGGSGNGNGNEQVRMNPQHQPSGHPSPSSKSKPKKRELTEEEKAFRKIQGFKSDEEYLAWTELEEGDVADATLGEDQ